ncbi:MAG: prolyl oligopeptidase family serine peptidase [Acidobacteriota bacterium]
MNPVSQASGKACNARDVKRLDRFASVRIEHQRLAVHYLKRNLVDVNRMSAVPDYAKAETIVPAGEPVVRDLFAAKDALYVQLMEGGIGRVLRFPFDGHGRAQEIRVPFAGSVALSGAHPQIEGILLTLTSWTKAPRICEYQPGFDALRDTKLQPLGKYDDPADLVSNEVKVKSHDGVLVPLSIVHKKGIKLDGKNPALLQGYGAYGISSDPYFNVRSLAWLEKGGILAIAHVRGGGEYGEEWHMAGFKKTKPNTWKDFIACAEYLIQNKYTSPQYLAGTGGSAGGILIGRALTERPDLFAAAIPTVGCLDMLRAETTSNGVPNIPEFGTVKDPEEFKALYEMSTLCHVKDKEAYPTVLFTHGMNDPRVDPWHSAKAAASLQAASTSGKPILLRLNYETGHGIGTTKRQAQEEYADMLSFILW